jgi:DNA-binding NtrC family response regulator
VDVSSDRRHRRQQIDTTETACSNATDMTSGGGAAKCILVVDDDSSVLNIASRALASYRVLVARDPDEALSFAKNSASLDLLITDFLMPSMTGSELMARIREFRPMVQVVMLTGHGDILDQAKPLGWETVTHLSKPVDIDELRATVARLIGPH